MPRLSSDVLAADWQQHLNSFAPHIQQLTADLATRYQTELAERFYTVMLQHSEAAVFLSHDEVKNRLSNSMQKWICSLYATQNLADIHTVIAHQHKIGEVHARISIPVHLVLRGARLLKERLKEFILTELEPQDIQPAISYAEVLIDMAMEIMSQAYTNSHERNSRAEESYRLFAITQNIANEKERQRAALLDWENQLMFDHAMGLSAEQLPRLRSSEFGLWFRHKGSHSFEGAKEMAVILDAMTQIDDVLLPLFGLRQNIDEPSGKVQLLRELREQAKSILYHLDLLFEQNNELESGRDVLTRLLNRKFLSVVLSKQVTSARSSGHSFAALAIDLDHFKQINDSYSHEAGDLVLQQLGAMLLNKSRAGDYLFRMGGEEFLLLLIDVDRANAEHTAEKIRKLIAAEQFRLPQGATVQLTASMGLAMFTGHPDHQQLLRRCDAALYQAKHNGRNQLVIAPD